MHFCEFATRDHGALSVPRKYGLNWFIPALVNSSVGSSCGTTGEEGTKVWPCFWMKKSRYCWRICAEVGMVGTRETKVPDYSQTESVEQGGTCRCETSLAPVPLKRR